MSSPHFSPHPSVVLPRQIVYPERTVPREKAWQRIATAVQASAFANLTRLRAARLSRIVNVAAEHEKAMVRASDGELRQQSRALRAELRRRPSFPEPIVGQSFALIREVAARRIGNRPFDVQLIGGYALLKGWLAEMDTGEGKTLTATLAAGTAALAGVPVHIVTVNDYLVQRDAAWMGSIYQFLGLSVGTIVHGQRPDERRAAYGCDITYCTNKELAFDYLRDRMILGQQTGNLRLKLERLYDDDGRAQKLLMRGLRFAIVDEADSVLIDEARTPLIISGEVDAKADRVMTAHALEIARSLKPGRDYLVLAHERRIDLTPRGGTRLTEDTARLDGPWRSRLLREELTRQALTAIHLIHRDEHYLLSDGKVQMIDEYTGRLMPDRNWSEGLHQMIEMKEGIELTERRVTLARMTYQRFFRRYERLAGMTGTARQVAPELWAVYGLPVASVPTNRPVRRQVLPDRVLLTKAEKWQAITLDVAKLHAQGRPVLLGTRSVAASQEASAYLTRAGLQHVILNAAQDRQESEIVARAGQRGRITIATNMAGRGTDITLGDGVSALGGLHVIMSERHDASRIDRQLAGRAGRQGEPGSFQGIVSLEDPLMDMDRMGMVRYFARRLMPWLGVWVGRLALRKVQRQTERVHSRMRRNLLRTDQRSGDAMAFTGQPE